MNTEKQKASDRAWYARHKEKKKTWAKSHRVSEKFAPAIRAKRILAKFGITAEEYDRLRAQAVFCPICGDEMNDTYRHAKQKVLDHCHKTGAIRGFLCRACNSKIGYFQDDPDLLERAVAWLRRPCNG